MPFYIRYLISFSATLLGTLIAETVRYAIGQPFSVGRVVTSVVLCAVFSVWMAKAMPLPEGPK